MICNDSQRLGPVLRLREPGDGGGAGRLARAGDPPQPRPHRQADGGEGEQPEVIMIIIVIAINDDNDVNEVPGPEQSVRPGAGQTGQGERAEGQQDCRDLEQVG